MSSLPNRILNWGFRRYVRRFVAKNFNAVRASGLDNLADLTEKPVVCFANHPGWWDPMTAVLMTNLLFPGRRFAAPMDGAALRNYPILERLGFFPVQRDTAGGAKEFLKTSRRLLDNPQTILWVTPAGRFHDVRQPASFMKGLSHLFASDFHGAALPMAVEYTFWNERYPELLVRFGQPVVVGDLSADREARSLQLEQALVRTQAALAELAIARDPAGFRTLAMGRAGVGGAYDLWRRTVARLHGRRFSDRHASELSDSEKVAEGGIA